MVEPIGWSSMRGSMHYKTVFPAMPDVGMHNNLHKNLSKRLQPKEILAINQRNIENARRILYRQRVALKLFSGSRLNLKGSTPHETSARLHRQPLRESTDREGFPNADAFSIMRSEGSTLLTEASLYGDGGGGGFPNIQRGRSGHAGHTGRVMSPILDSRLDNYPNPTDKMASYDPEKQPDSRGYLVKLNKPIVYKKKYTETEIQNIVKRLTDYDPVTHPAESKGVVRDQPSVVTQVPRQSMSKIKKCTSEEVQEIVERLYKFDSAKWPPESKARLKVYSGRPNLRTMTAPADLAVARPSVTIFEPHPPISPSPTQSHKTATEEGDVTQTVEEPVNEPVKDEIELS